MTSSSHRPIGQCDELLPTSGGRSPSVDVSDGIIAADWNFPQGQLRLEQIS